MSATFLLGDCLQQMKAMPNKSVDCFVCDLPYGQLSQNKKCLTDGRKSGCFQDKGNDKGCHWDVKIDLSAFWVEVKRLCKSDNTPVLMFCNTRFGIDLINSNPSWFRYDIVWDKGFGVSFLSANKQPMRSHEMIYVFSKKAPYYKRIDEVRNGKMRCPLSVVPCSKTTNKQHPTEKPEALISWLLERYCPPGGTVLDPTAGSFNTVFVAKQIGMKGIGIEKDNQFFWKAILRLTSLWTTQAC